MKAVPVSLLLLFCFTSHAQDQNITWKTLGLKGRVKTIKEYKSDSTGSNRILQTREEFTANGLLKQSYVHYTNGFFNDYTYDSVLHITRMKRTRMNGTVDAEYSWFYDEKGKLLKNIEDNKEDTAYNTIFLYTYDNKGRKIRSESRTLDNRYKNHIEYVYKQDTAYCTHYEYGRPSDYKIRIYDSLGRQTELIIRYSFSSPAVFMRYVTSFNEEGKEIKKTAYEDKGEFHHEFIYEYDSLGNQTRSIFSNLAGKEITTHEYTYDPAGNIIREVTRTDGKIKYVHEYEYEYFD